MHKWSVEMESVPEHAGTASTAYMIPKESMEAQTQGTYLALACVFEVEAGEELLAHQHPTHEYWFVLQGSGVMQVGQEAFAIKPGDLIYTEPNTPHKLKAAPGERFRAFCFAQGYPGQGSQHVDVDLPDARMTPVDA